MDVHAVDDEQFLYRLFDRALVEIEEGHVVRADELIEGREHLRSRVEELIRVASDIAVGEVKPLAPTLHGYTILGELGRGGMGSVYLARQERLGGRAVAVKVLPPSLALSPRARERFRSEVNAIAKLHHANIVSVFDLVEESGVHAFAMEWVDGTSLADIIKHLAKLKRPPVIDDVRAQLRAPAGALDAPTVPVFVCRVGIAMARALAAVHKEGLLHRDVKPSNVLLRRDGTPLLSDFGLVRDADAESLSRSGDFVGTPAYAAPEQLRGDRTLTPSADVYALGATLYHALTLRAPYSGRSTSEILRQIEAGSAPLIRRVVRDLPPDLETIIAKAMDPDSTRRYASADELADDLERLLTLQPIVARPAGILSRALKLVRRNRRSLLAALLGGTLALAIATALIVYWIFVPRWVKEHVDAAHVALLDPRQRNAIFSTEFMRARVEDRATAISIDAAERALASYAAALRLRPYDSTLQLERDAVRLSLDLIREVPAPPTLSAHLIRTAPLTCKIVRGSSGIGQRMIPSGEQLGTASATDLRALGIVCFLTGHIDDAVEAWSEFDRHADADPLLDAALGLVFLVREEGPRALHRLLKAIEAFPDVGFLAVYAADAAIQCGELSKARRLLDAARGMKALDPMSGLDRVEADLLAAQGDVAGARRRYLAVGHGIAQFHLARFLESRGKVRGALTRYVRAAETMPRSERAARAFVSCADRWWSHVDVPERWRLVCRSLDPATPWNRSLCRLVRIYAVAVALLRDDGSMDSSTKVEARTLSTNSNPSTILASLSLDDLAHRMDVSNVHRWERWGAYPAPLRVLQAATWVSPEPDAARACVDESWRLWLRGVTVFVRAALPTSKGNREASFQGIGDLAGGGFWTEATDVSADGSTVVGSSEAAGVTEPCRWKADVGIVGLGAMPRGSRDSRAVAVCADGRVIAGTFIERDASGAEHEEAFRWSVEDGVLGLGDLFGGANQSNAAAVTADGEQIFGNSSSAAGYEIFRWTKSTGTAGLGVIGYGIVDVSSNADVLIGEKTSAGRPNVLQPCRWWSGAQPELIADLPGGPIASRARDASDDGGVIVGYGTSARGEEAMRWTQASGMIGLGDLPGGEFRSEADAVAPAGDLVGGWGTSSFGCEAVIWNVDGHMERAVDFITRRGVTVPLGWFLTSVEGIAVNGDHVTLAGNGYNPAGEREAWVATYRPSP
ncbi:MAG: protein kinase [Planctomycetes bacterium]|nr:protein kinase [Planctomycetota bacterium]MBI3847134.1 protein kinase [Planctomycetota bacterium]